MAGLVRSHGAFFRVLPPFQIRMGGAEAEKQGEQRFHPDDKAGKRRIYQIPNAQRPTVHMRMGMRMANRMFTRNPARIISGRVTRPEP